MTDPLAEMVRLLQPTARFSKLVEGAGAWRVQRPGDGDPFYCVLLEGQCRMVVAGQPPIDLQAGDFVLVPAMRDLSNASPAGAQAAPTLPVKLGEGHFRVGRQDGAPEQRMHIGHCRFGSPDAALLVSLLPQVLHVRGVPRLATLVQWLGDETLAQRPAREVVLERLLEVLLIEALRSVGATGAGPGLALGLADERLAMALRALHARPEQPWTVAGLAEQAALSRSAFFARFTRTLGVAPMAYLLHWRMALAKRLLREGNVEIARVAEQVGYSSASTFSVAFARQVGMPPARYARQATAVTA
ncbi:AraC family transcriptional regulator [Stenotrophomonas sp. HITSZ_GD]|uniref:AraC family transcriptional regulator n=1 Tax=Stenotrophomonas sp. HITSZ_GD TaxID=3037248 RepID=UPI00240E7D78|nr:AraC family transcriptional regulator [Stenotrophomonas sp. HITSZ_GD]MDG2524259.1 AraC family transcriptional regulator [Stenotrophomonas sp. HITSZ_GD]